MLWYLLSAEIVYFEARVLFLGVLHMMDVVQSQIFKGPSVADPAAG